MMENITFITPTGDRPLTFALCQKWVKQQTLQPTQWIIVDDGKVPATQTIVMDNIYYLRREPQPDDPQHTLLANLKVALPLVMGDKIMVIEDDDYYAPKYAETMAAKLEDDEIVGIYNGRYYYLPTGGNCRAGNERHASLASTAFRRSFLVKFNKLVNTETGALDMRLWRTIKKGDRGHLFLDDSEPLYVGMKGAPGRPGKGGSHTPISWRYQQSSFDVSQELLRQWIPDENDFNIYRDMIAGKLTEDNYRSYLLKENK